MVWRWKRVALPPAFLKAGEENLLEGTMEEDFLSDKGARRGKRALVECYRKNRPVSWIGAGASGIVPGVSRTWAKRPVEFWEPSPEEPVPW
jgi:hypothetical protein